MATSKQQFVEDWIKELFADSSLPEYQLNQTNLDKLYELGQHVRENERQMNVVIENLQKQISKYQKEDANISSKLQAVGVTIQDLPLLSQKYVNVIAEAANDLQVIDTLPSHISLGMSELLCREATLKYELDCLNQELRKIKTNIDKASIDNEYFTKITNESSLKSAKFYDKEIKFLKEKSQQYKKLIESLQTELIDNDFSEDIQHRVLKQHYQDTLSLERQLQPIQSQLGNFADLPPDITLAKLKVYESKLELERLEKELAQHIDLIHLEN